MIAASFIQDVQLGIITTIAVAAHEIPQEIGDFGILVYGGLSVRKALLYNLLSASSALAGAIIAFFSLNQIIWLKDPLIPFAAGGFIYIALADMIPKLQERMEGGKTALQTVFMLAGLSLMWRLKVFLGH